MRQHQSGVALIVIILFTTVVLMAIIATTTQLSLSARRSSANDVAAYQAVLASESGQNAFVPRSIAKAYFTGPARCKNTQANCRTLFIDEIKKWLNPEDSSKQQVGSVSLGTAGSAHLTLVESSVAVSLVPGTGPGTTKPEQWTLTGLDIESTGDSANSNARVLQRYSAKKTDLPPLDIGAAVISHPGVALKGGAILNGQSLTESGNDGIYQNLLKVKLRGTGPAALVTGSEVDVDVSGSQSRASQATVGSYVRLPVEKADGSPGGIGTFQVTQNFGSSLRLAPVQLPAGGTSLSDAVKDMDFVYNGITSVSSTSMVVRATQSFVKGNDISFKYKDSAGKEMTYTGTVTQPPTEVTGGVQLTLNPPLPTGLTSAQVVGLPVTKSTLGVITAGVYKPGKNTPVGGTLDVTEDALLARDLAPSPLNDALFIKTFGMTPAELKSRAYVQSEAEFVASGAAVEGLMWVRSTDGKVQLNSSKPQGSGILVIDGDLNLNVNEKDSGVCGLSGLIYVRGNLNIQGGLEMCGSIVVEGSILDKEGTVTGVEFGDDSQFAGNGRKVTYDPDALFEAMSGAGEYKFTALGNWRQR